MALDTCVVDAHAHNNVSIDLGVCIRTNVQISECAARGER
ncbi:MAG: hypothetical protein ACJAU6_002661 [Alphaproteobacteria bacterium]|jgi:hypothetical protein